MVANKNKLRGKMAENECTMQKLAKALGLAEATVRYKINSDKYDFNLLMRSIWKYLFIFK